MPRMNTCEEELLPASGALLANCRFGTTWSSISVLNTWRSSSAVPLIAVIAMGVRCRFSATLRAVTMTSSRPCGSDCWANAPGDRIAASVDEIAAARIRRARGSCLLIADMGVPLPRMARILRREPAAANRISGGRFFFVRSQQGARGGHRHDPGAARGEDSLHRPQQQGLNAFADQTRERKRDIHLEAAGL